MGWQNSKQISGRMDGSERPWYDKMNKKTNQKALSIMEERFGHDTLISIATIDGSRPAVRTVNSYYEDGASFKGLLNLLR